MADCKFLVLNYKGKIIKAFLLKLCSLLSRCKMIINANLFSINLISNVHT